MKLLVSLAFTLPVVTTLLLVVTLGAGGMTAQSGAATAVSEVLAAQAERFSATTARDVARLEKVIGDELAYGHSGGTVDGKRWYLDAAASGRYQGFVPQGMKVDVYGNAAVITGLIDVKTAAGARRFRTIEVHVKRDGRWQLVHVQFTTLAQ